MGDGDTHDYAAVFTAAGEEGVATLVTQAREFRVRWVCGMRLRSEEADML